MDPSASNAWFAGAILPAAAPQQLALSSCANFWPFRIHIRGRVCPRSQLSSSQFSSPALWAGVRFLQRAAKRRIDKRWIIYAVIDFYGVLVHLNATHRTKHLWFLRHSADSPRPLSCQLFQFFLKITAPTLRQCFRHNRAAQQLLVTLLASI